MSKTVHAEDPDANFLTKLIYHLDLYGVKPKHKVEEHRNKIRKHFCGFLTSMSLTAMLLLVILYSMNELLTYQYNSYIGRFMADNILSEATNPRVPEVGVMCCTEKWPRPIPGQAACDSRGFIHVTMKQRFMIDQQKEPKVYLGMQSCAIGLGANSSKYMSDFQNADGSMNMLCPENHAYVMQGIYEAKHYRYLQIDINSCPWVSGQNIPTGSGCLAGSQVEDWVKYARCTIYEENQSHNLTALVFGDVPYNDPVPIRRRPISYRFHYQESTTQKVDIYHQIRTINLKHWFMDLGALEEKYDDVSIIKTETVQQYNFELEEPFIKFYIRMTEEAENIRVVPENTMFSMISDWGAYWALLSALGALVIFQANSWYYAKRATSDSLITSGQDAVGE